MPLNWIDLSQISFNTLLLLEQAQLSWFPGWLPERDLGLALKANPTVEWYLRHKCPSLNDWLDRVQAGAAGELPLSAEALRQAELRVLAAIADLVVYAVDPAAYDAQPFLGWNSRELLSLTDFNDKIVIDVGSGTGRLALAVADQARAVFAVEPVANLRQYLKQKARAGGAQNVYPLDGLITDMPFPPQFADVCMAGHVFGDNPAAEYEEMARVTKIGGLIILCPGNNDCENDVHAFLTERGFAWARFEEPQTGWRRKYWCVR